MTTVRLCFFESDICLFSNSKLNAMLSIIFIVVYMGLFSTIATMVKMKTHDFLCHGMNRFRPHRQIQLLLCYYDCLLLFPKHADWFSFQTLTFHNRPSLRSTHVYLFRIRLLSLMKQGQITTTKKENRHTTKHYVTVRVYCTHYNRDVIRFGKRYGMGLILNVKINAEQLNRKWLWRNVELNRTAFTLIKWFNVENERSK